MLKTLPVAVAVTLLVGALSLEARAQEARCDAPQVMIVVDHSSSMGTRAPLPDGSLKWDAAVEAITEITAGYESLVDFGLMVYPSEGECTPGVEDVPVGPLRADAIEAALPGEPPYSGNYTPTSQSLDAASEIAALRSEARRSVVLLITDGWQWCDPYDADTRFDPVASTENLDALGITTHVVGFGESVDSLTLNRMAHTAGTALPGCDPTSDDPTRANNCYHQVDDLAALRDALEAIARSLTEEICDGLDNDCDGEIDEDLSRDCESVCGDGIEVCVDGAWTDCDAPLPEVEICDGVDNDCNGIVDPGCACNEGETMVCGIDEGVCVSGLQTCEGGAWTGCEGSLDPMAEVCDGSDNDCDGAIDEDAECGMGFACVDGACVDLGDGTPPDGEATTGCACRATGSGPASEGLVVSLLLAGLLGLARRR